MAPRVDKKYRDEIEKARTELHNIAMSNNKSNAPHLLRLAYASQFSIANSQVDDAATKATQTKPTPSDDTISILTKIQKIKVDHPIITHPDLYQLAGIVAVEVLDGPKVEFVPGRTDSSILPDESCLPDVKQSPSDLKKVFGKVGISEPKHIAALCGGLKLARSGPVQGPILKFDDPYFMEPGEKEDSSPTDEPLLDKKKDSSLTDKPLLDKKKDSSPTNKEAFFKDYEEAHKKLSEYGLPHSSFIRSALEKSTATQRAVAAAAAVVIFGVFYLINRRRAKHSQQFH